MPAVNITGANTAAGVTTVQGHDFPNELKQDKEYVLLTTGTRVKFFIKGYALGVYVEKEKMNAVLKALGGKAGIEKLAKEKKLHDMLMETIAKNKIATKACLVFLREFTGKFMGDALRETLKPHMEKADFEAAKVHFAQILPADSKLVANDYFLLETNCPKADCLRVVKNGQQQAALDKNVTGLNAAINKVFMNTTTVNDTKANLEKTAIAMAAK